VKNREIITEAKHHLKGNIWRAVLIVSIVALLPSLIHYGINWGTFVGMSDAATSPDMWTVIFQGIAAIVIGIIASFLTIGEKWSYLHMVDNEKLSIKMIVNPFTHRPGRNIWHTILQFLLIFVWMIVGMIGLGLLIVGVNWLIVQYWEISFFTTIFIGFLSFMIGLLALAVWTIFIRFWFILSEYILYEDRTVSAYDSLTFSRRLMKGYKRQLFRLVIRLFFLWFVLTVTIPIVIVSIPLVFQDQIWLWGLIIAISVIGYFIYTYFVQIRWQASLAVFYRMILSERFE